MACPSFCRSFRLEATYRIPTVSTPRENSHQSAAAELPSNIRSRSMKQKPAQISIVRQTIGMRPSPRKIHAKTM